MEFLLGRSLSNNLTDLLVEPIVQDIIQREGLDMVQLAQEEPDAGLGNGGLARLAACFSDSLATMLITAIGYGLRYHYGIFRQRIRNGHQIEYPDLWLRHSDPWEVARPEEIVPIKFNASIRLENGVERVFDNQPAVLLGTPTIGRSSAMVAKRSTLSDCGRRALLKHSTSTNSAAVTSSGRCIKRSSPSLTRVLYPDDSTERGRSLRFTQEYFLVACSLADIIARFRRRGNEWQALPEEGGDPTQRHASRRGGGRTHAHSARSGRAELRGGLGSHHAHAGVYQPHLLARSVGEVARAAV